MFDLLLVACVLVLAWLNHDANLDLRKSHARARRAESLLREVRITEMGLEAHEPDDAEVPRGWSVRRAKLLGDIAPERAVCGVCDGDGQYWEHYGHCQSSFDMVDCRACGGTGDAQGADRG